MADVADPETHNKQPANIFINPRLSIPKHDRWLAFRQNIQIWSNMGSSYGPVECQLLDSLLENQEARVLRAENNWVIVVEYRFRAFEPRVRVSKSFQNTLDAQGCRKTYFENFDFSKFSHFSKSLILFSNSNFAFFGSMPARKGAKCARSGKPRHHKHTETT